MLVDVCIPILNAEPYLYNLLEKLKNQKLEAECSLEILVADSSSEDRSLEICREFNIEPCIIPPGKFDNGGTRTMLAKKGRGEILVFMTQDAYPVNDFAIQNLIKAFRDSKVVAAYGRQLPNKKASPIGAHLRLYNYPKKSSIRSWKEKKRYGIKTIFFSNSFSAYRRKALKKINWFNEGLLFGEDSLACAKFIYDGWKVAYISDAMVYHSHDYTCIEEFRRYFDVGVLHKTESWAFKYLPKAEKEGIRYIRSVSKYLWMKKKWISLFGLPIRTIGKLIGYTVGKNYKIFPKWVILRISMSPFWWEKRWEKRNKDLEN